MRQVIAQGLRSFLRDPALRYSLLLFFLARLFLTVWAFLVLAIRPLPVEPDELVRPYLGEAVLDQGPAGLLLGPWQRFDAQHYLRIARQGYAAAEDSVFPPLYPLTIQTLGRLFRPFAAAGTANLIAAIILSNGALVAALILLYRVTEAERDETAARRATVYLTLFPTAFFLLAPYTESLFLLFALASLWSARRQRFWLAGLLGVLAALTRLTGWVLVVPLLYELLKSHSFQVRRTGVTLAAPFLPLAATLAFLAWRTAAGLPPLDQVYQEFWYQTTRFPGHDLVTAFRQMFAGEGTFTLAIDFLTTLFLLATTVLAFRRLGVAYGLYSALLLLFMLLPASNLKPLFSFSRYTLAFFPTFMVLGDLGRSPWWNRLIAYPSLALSLYFSGQFFMWGWVA